MAKNVRKISGKLQKHTYSEDRVYKKNKMRYRPKSKEFREFGKKLNIETREGGERETEGYI